MVAAVGAVGIGVELGWRTSRRGLGGAALEPGGHLLTAVAAVRIGAEVDAVTVAAFLIRAAGVAAAFAIGICPNWDRCAKGLRR